MFIDLKINVLSLVNKYGEIQNGIFIYFGFFGVHLKEVKNIEIAQYKNIVPIYNQFWIEIFYVGIFY